MEGKQNWEMASEKGTEENEEKLMNQKRDSKDTGK